MKHLIALLLASVMCLTGCATNQKSDTISVNETIQETTEDILQETEIIESKTEIITQAVEISTIEIENNLSTIQAQNLNFLSLNDDNLLRYVEDNVYSRVVDGLNSEKYFVENVEAVYVSKEYLEELFYNSQENIYFGYKLSDITSQWGDTKYIFTVDESGQTTVQAFEEYDDTYDKVLRNVAIGTGVILVCVTVSAVTGGLGTAPAVSMIFAASAKTGTIMALSSGAIGGAATAITCGIEGKSLDETLKESALSASEGFMWGAIGGAVSGGAAETFALKGATANGLTMNEAAQIQKKSKYPLDVIKQFKSMDEFKVYQEAGLKAELVNGRMTLIREIDLNYKVPQPDGSFKTNLQLMEEGKAPFDANTGQRFQLHHINQKSDGTLAILNQTEHQGNSSILNTVGKESEIDREAFDKVREEFWKAMASKLGG